MDTSNSLAVSPGVEEGEGGGGQLHLPADLPITHINSIIGKEGGRRSVGREN